MPVSPPVLLSPVSGGGVVPVSPPVSLSVGGVSGSDGTSGLGNSGSTGTSGVSVPPPLFSESDVLSSVVGEVGTSGVSSGNSGSVGKSGTSASRVDTKKGATVSACDT